MSESRELTPMETFQEKVKARLKDDICDMLPDEALTKLVEQATHEMFFQPVTRTRDYRTITEPSWFQTFVETEFKAVVRQHAREYVEGHRDQLDQMVRTAITNQVPAMMNELASVAHQYLNELRNRPVTY